MRGPLKALRDVAGNLRKKPMKEIIDLISSGILEWNLSILPGYSDLVKIIDIMTNFKARVNRFLETSNRLETRRHFIKAVDLRQSVEELFKFKLELSSFNTLQNNWAYYWLYEPTLEPQTVAKLSSPKDKGIYAAYMDFDYCVSKLVECDSFFLSALQQFGVRPDASIIWNAIPFSFVVDWFFRVGDYLQKNYSIDVISALVNVHRFSESLRLRLSWDLKPCVRPGYVDANDFSMSTPSVASSAIHGQVYARYQALPDVDNSFTTGDGFDLKRTAVSAALLQKGVRRR